MKPLRFLRQDVLQSVAAHDTLFLYFSNLIAAGIGFAVSLVIARKLGPADFGVITAYNSIVYTLAGFTDFGLGTGLIKFTSPHLKEAPHKAAAYFRTVLFAEITSGFLVLVIGLLLSKELAHLLGAHLPPSIMSLAIVAAAVTSASAYVAASLAAHKLFKRNAVLSTCISLLRMSLVLALVLTATLSLRNVLIGYVALAFISAIAGFAVAPKDYLKTVPIGSIKKAANDLFRFSGWLTLTFLITSVMGRLDFFYLYKLRGATDAGVYAAAIQLSMIFSMLIGAISTVLTPSMSEKTKYHEIIGFLRKLMPVMFVIATLLVISSVAFPSIINLLFGDKYMGASGPLTILIVHLALNVILIPITLAFIPLGKIRFGTYISILQLVIALIAYPVLITNYGSIGASLTILINTVAALLIYPLILLVLLRRQKRGHYENQ